jgi:hypothetical protein
MGYARLAAVAAVILVLNHRYGNAKSMAYRRLTDEAANAIAVASFCSAAAEYVALHRRRHFQQHTKLLRTTLSIFGHSYSRRFDSTCNITRTLLQSSLPSM